MRMTRDRDSKDELQGSTFEDQKKKANKVGLFQLLVIRNFLKVDYLSMHINYQRLLLLVERALLE